MTIHKYQYKGKTLTIRQLAEMANITYNAMLNRIKANGEKIDKTIFQHKRIKFYEYNGEILTIQGWADKAGINYAAMRFRIKTNGYRVTKHILNKKLPFTPHADIFVEDENGQKWSLNQIAIKNNLSYKNVYERYKYGKKYRDIKKLGAPLFSL